MGLCRCLAWKVAIRAGKGLWDPPKGAEVIDMLMSAEKDRQLVERTELGFNVFITSSVR
jgi:hypothetical protein